MYYDYIVDQSGNGTHTSIQAAIDDASGFWSRLCRLFRRAQILVRAGTYKANVDCRFVSLWGEPRAE